MQYVLALLLSVLAASRALADGKAYDGTKVLVARAGSIRAEHQHDWSSWESKRGWLLVIDERTGRILVEQAAPPFTTLWLSRDGSFLVALSSIMIFNDVQLLVVDNYTGDQISRRVRCGAPYLRHVTCHESVTNIVDWYKSDDPGLELIVASGVPTEVKLNAPLPFQCGLAKPPSNVKCDVMRFSVPLQSR